MNNNEPAFPGPIDANLDGSPIYATYEKGMTLRDYFAAKAMQALLSKHAKIPSSERDKNLIADTSYLVADEMLKARNAKTS